MPKKYKSVKKRQNRRKNTYKKKQLQKNRYIHRGGSSQNDWWEPIKNCILNACNQCNVKCSTYVNGNILTQIIDKLDSKFENVLFKKDLTNNNYTNDIIQVIINIIYDTFQNNFNTINSNCTVLHNCLRELYACLKNNSSNMPQQYYASQNQNNELSIIKIGNYQIN